MKAAMVERPGRLVVSDIPEPEIGPYDVRCEILYGAVCTGTDHHLIAGNFPWPVNYPTILGHESIGRVVEVGSQVRSFRLGDLISRVGTPPSPQGDFAVNWGGFAEQGIARDHRAMREDGLPRAQWDRFRINQIIPPDIDPAAATMIITWRETWSYINRMGVGAGARVLIIGSGGNGLAYVAHARNLQAAEVVLVGNRERQELARELGATGVLDYTLADIEVQLQEQYPERFDFIIDAVGKQGQLNRVLSRLRAGGTIGMYGLDDWGTCTIDPSRAHGTFTYYNGGYDEEEAHEQIVRFIQQGALRAEHWIDLQHPYPLADIHRAFADLSARKTPKALIAVAEHL